MVYFLLNLVHWFRKYRARKGKILENVLNLKIGLFCDFKAIYLELSQSDESKYIKNMSIKKIKKKFQKRSRISNFFGHQK